MKQRKPIGPQIPGVRNFALGRSLGQDLADESQIPKVLLLCRKAERTEPRSRLERAQINRSNELLVGRQAIEQAMNDREEFFRQAGVPNPLIALVPGNDLR